MHWWWDGWHMGWMVVGWLIGIALVAAVIWVLITATRREQQWHAGPPQQDAAESLLRQRYARGEIDRKEYQERLEDLRKSAPRP